MLHVIHEKLSVCIYDLIKHENTITITELKGLFVQKKIFLKGNPPVWRDQAGNKKGVWSWGSLEKCYSPHCESISIFAHRSKVDWSQQEFTSKLRS